MLKAFSRSEKLLAAAWCLAGAGACVGAAVEVRSALHARGGLPVNAGAGVAFAAAVAAATLLSFALSFRFRFLEKLGALFAAAAGSALAKGRLELWAAQEHVWGEWRRYQGLRDAEPTAEAVYEFVNVTYGVDLSGAVKRAGRMTTRQLRRLVDGITSLLLRYKRWNVGKADGSMPESLADAIEAARQSLHQAQGDAGHAATGPQFGEIPAQSLTGQAEYGELNFNVDLSNQGLIPLQPQGKKSAAPRWVSQPPPGAVPDAIEFDVKISNAPRPQTETVSIQEILARATRQEPPKFKAPPPQAHVESGAVLRRISERELLYHNRCEPCGYVEGTIRKARPPGARMKLNSTFRCPRCRNVQKVVISGAF